MKNIKRIVALLGVLLLLSAACLPMYFALTGERGEAGTSAFIASMAVAIFVPVMAFAMVMVYKALDKRNQDVPKEREIDNIIFDVGNVLVDYDWSKYLKSYGFSEEKFEKIADATFRNRIWEERDRGLYKEEEYLRQFIAQAPEYETEIREVIGRSEETLEVFPYAEAWVKYLKSQGYHLYILSNFCEYMLGKTRKDMTFLKYMDGIAFSCEINELKPEKGMYQKLLDMYGLDPERSVFLDDREANCAGARALGIRTIQFRNLQQASEELEKLGVK